MRDIFRVRVKTRTGEIEIEGTQQFVESKINTLPGLVCKLDNVLAAETTEKSRPDTARKTARQVKTAGVETTKKTVAVPGNVVVPNGFKQWYGKFQENIRQADKLLLAAYFMQYRSPDNVFKSFLANQTLKNNGISLTSPDTSLNRLVNEKLVVISKQAGKLTLYQVSETGKRHLIGLIAKNNS